jgi:hypothetical protein
MDPSLPEVSPIDCLGIIVRYPRGLRCLSDRVSLLVNEPNELESLLICDLHIYYLTIPYASLKISISS